MHFFKREKSNFISLLTYLPFPKDLNFHLVSLPFNLINFLQNVTDCSECWLIFNAFTGKFPFSLFFFLILIRSHTMIFGNYAQMTF